MYHASKPADWTDQAWIDWLHEELSGILDKLHSADHGLSHASADHAFDYAVHMADPSAQVEDFNRDWGRHIRESEQFLDRSRLELTRFILDHLEVFRRLHDATPNVQPIEIRTDFPAEETAEQMTQLGKHFRQLLHPLAVNSPYADNETTAWLDEMTTCPRCGADGSPTGRNTTSIEYQCGNCFSFYTRQEDEH